ncbi:MAG: leucine-rich repeat domain-containing protein [Clostridia bacterium]|nr:leucine-rich repeat domain-containing protein [Clostridia bacterium]
MAISAKKTKKLLCLLLALITALSVCSLCASAETKSSGEEEEENVLYEGDFCYVVSGKNAVIIRYIGKGGNVVIPEKLGGLPAAQMRGTAFHDNEDVVSVQLPAAMLDITDEQFCLCENLKSVTVASGNPVYTSVDGVLFKDKGKTICIHPAAHSVQYDIPQGVKKIAPFAFFTNKRLTTVTIPSSVKEIGRNAFYDCSSLRAAHIPDSVTKVGAGAFSWCIALKDLRVPDKLSDIGRRAFYPTYATTHADDDFVLLGDGVLVAYLGNPRYVTIPSYVKAVADVFYASEEVEEVIISEGVERINDSAFFGCTALEKVEIPNSVKKIGDWAFYGCPKLRGVNIPDGAELGAYSFGACEKLKSVSVNCKEVPSGAFEYCTRLSSVELGKNVERIGHYAFYACEALGELKLPKAVTEIGESALRRTAITALTLSDNIESIGPYAFTDNDGIVLTVTDGTYAYKYAKKNGYEMKVKEATADTKKADDKKKKNEPKADEAGFFDKLLEFYEEYKLYVFIGAGALVLLIVLLVVLLAARRRRRRRLAGEASVPNSEPALNLPGISADPPPEDNEE